MRLTRFDEFKQELGARFEKHCRERLASSEEAIRILDDMARRDAPLKEVFAFLRSRWRKKEPE